MPDRVRGQHRSTSGFCLLSLLLLLLLLLMLQLPLHLLCLLLLAALPLVTVEKPSQAVEATDQGLLAARKQLHLQCGWLAAAAHFLP